MKFKRRNLEITPPFISLADVAFNLVLFFLIFAKVKDDRLIEWKPAQGSGTKQVGKAKVSIIVDIEKRIYLNGKQVAVKELSGLIESQLGDAQPGNRLVILKIDKEAPAGTFEPVLEAVSQAGGELVHVLKEQPKQ